MTLPGIKDRVEVGEKQYEKKQLIIYTFSSTLKKPSKNYTCFISRRFGLFLIHLQSKNNQE